MLIHIQKLVVTDVFTVISFKKVMAFKKAVEGWSKLILLALRALLATSHGGSLLGKQHCLDVGKNTSLSNGDASQKLVQLFVVSDGQLKVARVDPLLLVVTGSVSSKLEYLGGEILHDCSEVDWSASSNSFCVVASLQQTVNSANRELQSSPT